MVSSLCCASCWVQWEPGVVSMRSVCLCSSEDKMWARQQEWKSWDFCVLRMVLHNLNSIIGIPLCCFSTSVLNI